MLTSSGRAVARRIPLARPAAGPFQLFAQPLALRPARPLSVSARLLFAADGPKKKTTTTKKADTGRLKAQKTQAKRLLKLPLTPEEKAQAKEKKRVEREKAELRQLKKMALLDSEPETSPNTAWTLFVQQKTKGVVRPELGNFTQQVATDYNNLSAAEKEELDNLAAANRTAHADAYKAWVESHPVEETYLANTARRALKARTNKFIKLITDERFPKPARNAYIQYSQERLRADRENGTSRSSAERRSFVRDISDAWKNLSDAEKRPYQDMAASEDAIYRPAINALKERVKEIRKEMKDEIRAAEREKKEAKRLQKNDRRRTKKSDE